MTTVAEIMGKMEGAFMPNTARLRVYNRAKQLGKFPNSVRYDFSSLTAI